jgi:cytochrome P450
MANLERPENVPAERVVNVNIYDLPLAEQDPQLAWRRLRETADLVWSPYHDGHWIALSADLLETLYKDPVTFSSRYGNVPRDPDGLKLIPLQADGALHTSSRQMFDAWFKPSTLEPSRKQARELSIQLIEGFLQNGRCEFISEFAQILPLVIFLTLVDLPLADRERLHTLVERMVRGSDDPVEREQITKALTDYLTGWLELRRREPGDDILSRVVHGELLGQPVSHEQSLSIGVLLLLGGLDTVASMMGFVMRHLASHPEHRRWIANNPQRIAGAVEELMRRHGVASNMRMATRDVVLDGVTIRAGDCISTPTAAHGLDERRFANPAEVDFERKPQTTLVFGAGPHRCPGMNLARLEIRIMIEEWLARIPEFEIDPDVEIIQKAGPVNGMSQLGLRW